MASVFHGNFKEETRLYPTLAQRIVKTTVLQKTCYRFVIVLFCLTSFDVDVTDAARPFWTKTPSYVEGEYLYVLGAVSNMPSLEEGKQQALVHGKLELMNVAQISEVGVGDLSLESRHTYIENNSDGSVNVYQLFRIPAAKVLEAQANVQTQRKTQTRALERSQQELTTLYDSLVKKQRIVNDQIASIEKALAEIQKAHEKYTAQSRAFDKRQLEIEQLQTTLRGKFTFIDKEINRIEELLKQFQKKSQGQNVLLNGLKEIEASLQEKEMKVQQLQQAILTRLEHTSNMACEYVSRGMTPKEVKKLLGTPAGEKHSYSNERYDTWAYGTAKVNFDAQGVVESVIGCNSQNTLLENPTPQN